MDKYIKFDWSELDESKNYAGLTKIVSLIMSDNVVSNDGKIITMKTIDWDKLRSTLNDQDDLNCFDELKSYITSNKL